MTDDLREYMKSRQALVEEYLRGSFRPGDGCPLALAEAMRYSLLAPGKRLRPLLVLMACEAGGGRDEIALPAACAVEMIHTYSLIHDDLPAMDDDDLRRGLPTCHKQFGEALAILAGDALLTLAFEVLADRYPGATAAAMCRELARGAGAAGMVGGQVLDLAAEGRLRMSTSDAAKPRTALSRNLEALAEIHALKTGALFRGCLRLGALAAQGERPGGPDASLLRALDSYGYCFGLVFQITDDLLDVEGDAAQLGKQVRKDAVRGKLTYPGLLGAVDSRCHAEEYDRLAQEALQPLGAAAERLADLIRFILARDR
ncbi:MAG TPA: farnesyl diphosphate synthase [Gemmataceae bacterium]|nr:farnesyl diphosphate synthase [Gemmataceae bacterium]